MSSAAIDRFNRRCGIAGLLILFGMVAVNGLVRPKFNDFPQYYMGGLMALRGEWESLYPDPYPGSTDNAGNVAASRMRPRYAELAASAGVGDGNRYFHPPPVAILLAPLALFPYAVAHAVWQLILLLAGWRVAVWAGRFYVEQHGASRMAGWGTLLVAASPVLYRGVRSSNLSSLVALFLAWIVWDLWRGKTLWGAAGMVLGVLFKYQPAVLVPLLLVTRRYRTIGISAAAGLAVVAIGLIVGGVSPYQRYLFEILPTMWTMPLWNNQVLSAFLLQVLDEPVMSGRLQTGIRGGSLLLMAGILALIWRARAIAGGIRPALRRLLRSGVVVCDREPAVLGALLHHLRSVRRLDLVRGPCRTKLAGSVTIHFGVLLVSALNGPSNSSAFVAQVPHIRGGAGLAFSRDSATDLMRSDRA